MNQNEIRSDMVHSVLKRHHRPHVASCSASGPINSYVTILILVVLFGSKKKKKKSNRSEIFPGLCWMKLGENVARNKKKLIENQENPPRRGFSKDVIKAVSINVTLHNGKPRTTEVES